MAHSDSSPSRMTQDLALSAVNPDACGSPTSPVHVTLPTPARKTEHQKSPSSPGQSPLTTESQRLPLDDFFGTIPHHIPPVDPEKQESNPRNMFAHEEEPYTIIKYIFYYGFILPPVWVFGSLVLCTKPTPMDDELGGNSESSVPSRGRTRRNSRLHALHVQAAERRWGLRCLYALVTFLICIACLIIGLWAGRVGAFANR